MRVVKIVAPAAVILSLTPALVSSAFAGSDPTGIWINETGRGAIEIKPCGNALCGNVVWVKSSDDADGCGKQIIGGVTSVGGGRWDNGWIYSPEKGRKYDVELTPLKNGNLKVVGYAGMKFLSKTMIWKPAPPDLQLCTATQDAKAPDAAPAGTPNAPGTAPDSTAKAKANAAPPAPVKPQSEKTDDTEKEASTPAASPDQSKTAPDKTAKAESDAPTDADGEEPAGNLGKMKIGDIELDKVLTKTKNGKCKLDLPWVKVTIDCER